MIAYRPPYDWKQVIGFLAARAIAGVETVRDGVYRRTWRDGEHCATLRVEFREAGLDVTPGLPDAVLARIRLVFDTARDPAALAARFGADPLLGRCIARRPGLRIPGGWDGFELAIRAVLGQQVSVAAARNLAGRLVALCEPAHTSAVPGLTHLFPTPERLLAADLAALGMPAARRATLRAIAAAALAEPALFEAGPPLPDAVARLRAIPGVGEWTAQYIALRALRDPDAFPASDIGLLRGAASNGVRPSPAALLARAEAWRPHRAFAAQHLWTADPADPGAGP